MLNIVAVQLVTYLLRGPLIDPAQAASGARIPQTERLSPNADLPMLLGGTRLHLGVVIAVGDGRRRLGLALADRASATGFAPSAPAPTRPAMPGIPVRSMTMLALTLSGALCGLAGAILVFGSESHRFVTDGSSTGFTGSAGFNGIVAALFGALHPLWTIPSSFLFGGLLVGANAMQRAIQIPASLVVALNGSSCCSSSPAWTSAGGCSGAHRRPRAAALGRTSRRHPSTWSRSTRERVLHRVGARRHRRLGRAVDDAVRLRRPRRDARAAQRRAQPRCRRRHAARRVLRLLGGVGAAEPVARRARRSGRRNRDGDRVRRSSRSSSTASRGSAASACTCSGSGSPSCCTASTSAPRCRRRR